MAKIVKNHSLGKEEVKKRIEDILPDLANQHNLTYKWVNDYIATFEGSGAKGQFVITDNTIEGDITLGLLLKVLEGKIVSAISERLDTILG